MPCDHSKNKGDLAELAVAHDLVERGYQILFPFGENNRYDIVTDMGNGRFCRIQTKYSVSTEHVWVVKPYSMNGYTSHKYTSADVEYIAAYDARTKEIMYIDAIELGVGVSTMAFRYTLPANNQTKGIRFVRDYQQPPK